MATYVAFVSLSFYFNEKSIRICFILWCITHGSTYLPCVCRFISRNIAIHDAFAYLCIHIYVESFCIVLYLCSSLDRELDTTHFYTSGYFQYFIALNFRIPISVQTCLNTGTIIVKMQKLHMFGLSNC